MPAIRIGQFDTWQGGYGLATVRVVRANTTILADIYEDEALTVPAANPQTLLEKTIGSSSFGKFVRPLYTDQAYSLQINSVDTTGTVRPSLTTLDGEDASKALVKPTNASRIVTLEEIAARRVDVADHGEFLPVASVGASPASNTAAIVAAIGAVMQEGGGIVELPGGTFAFEPFTIPTGVILRGRGIDATTLQCTQGGIIVTLGGERSGLAHLTLDGLLKAATSVGVHSLGVPRPTLDAVKIKRFETGLHCRGGEQPGFRNLTVSDCSFGARLHGDNATASGGTGTPMLFTRWEGGRIEYCSMAGLELTYIDLPCINTTISGIGFVQNTEDAVVIDGARNVRFNGCWWEGNTRNLTIRDGDPVGVDNTVIDVLVENGRMVGGTLSLRGHLESVIFKAMDLEGITVDLTPERNVIAQDCRESNVTLMGAATAWLRSSTTQTGTASGLTTGNAATKAWGMNLEPGERVFLKATVVGRGRNHTGDGFYHMAVSARRPGATLTYERQTAQFAVGGILTGQSSGATARIVADNDGGTTGTLTLQDVVGEFVDNEIIKDSGTGSASVNGLMVRPNVELVGTTTLIRPDQETTTSWVAEFVANQGEVELRVTGAASQTTEWTAHVEVTGL